MPHIVRKKNNFSKVTNSKAMGVLNEIRICTSWSHDCCEHENVCA